MEPQDQSSRPPATHASTVDNEPHYPTIFQLWKRFGHARSSIHARTFSQGDTTTSVGDDPVVNAAPGDIIEDMELTPCTAECNHDVEDSVKEGVSLLRIRPDRRIEIMRNGKDGATSVEVFGVETKTVLSPDAMAALPDPKRLCEACEGYDFGFLLPGSLASKEDEEWMDDLDERPGELVAVSAEEIAAMLAALNMPKDLHRDFHKTFSELQQSAADCAVCALLLAALPDAEGFVADDGRPLILRPDSRNDMQANRSIRNIEVGYPELDPLHPGVAVTRFGTLDVVCEHDSLAAAWPMGIRGRPVPPADDPTQALRWMAECQLNHGEACGFAGDHRPFPTRVIRIPQDGHQDPWLEDGAGLAGEYVALTYRWGGASMSKTLTSNLDNHRKAVPLAGLSKTIQDAIKVTRDLGYEYLWVDSLCIIQDSKEDWAQEASRMATVYSNADLTISASASSSADSGLFFKPTPAYLIPLMAKTIYGKPYCEFSLAVRNCSSFEDDVENGVLSDRGWCLQERVLSRKILHFGRSQIHWECLGGVWSADYSFQNEIDARPLSIRKSFQGELQRSTPRPGPKLILDEPGPAKELQIRMNVTEEEFSKLDSMPLPALRQLFATDKLAALAGLASVFAAKTGDSSVGLGHHTYETRSTSILLDDPDFPPRAPSWSWAALDGRVMYPYSKYSYVDAVLHAYTVPGERSKLPTPPSLEASSSCCCEYLSNTALPGNNPTQRLILKARLSSLSALRGFSPEQRKHLRENKDSRSALFVPHAVFDDPEKDFDDIEGVYAVFIAQVGCGMRDCGHRNNCGAGFAHCLLVEGEMDETIGRAVWRRVGVAQCFSGDFAGVLKVYLVLV
ncbi:heterokaryon incompatibility protein-domain-containing protein [Cladorrhinum samala]|uniref:Heterokaryon incompatibility protein-domain-containing protein n=1 Tax=Cladorrhinum samala TaxID=585594 RepID=A0AAV9I183_9PEZI|nr:heterokaryon incompatibility protein-domain-containing protein [Cladorrhinum samala]